MGLRRHSPAGSGGGVAGAALLQLLRLHCRSVLFLGRRGPRLTRLSPLHSIFFDSCCCPVTVTQRVNQRRGLCCSHRTKTRNRFVSIASGDAATEKVPPGARVRALSTTTQWNTMEHIAQALVAWERGRHRKRLLLRSLVMLSGSSA